MSSQGNTLLLSDARKLWPGRGKAGKISGHKDRRFECISFQGNIIGQSVATRTAWSTNVLCRVRRMFPLHFLNQYRPRRTGRLFSIARSERSTQHSQGRQPGFCHIHLWPAASSTRPAFTVWLAHVCRQVHHHVRLPDAVRPKHANLPKLQPLYTASIIPHSHRTLPAGHYLLPHCPHRTVRLHTKHPTLASIYYYICIAYVLSAPTRFRQCRGEDTYRERRDIQA